MEKKSESIDCTRRYVKENSCYLSTTDPDAGILNRGRPKHFYQVHRAMDGRSEVITAVETTSGDVNNAHEMAPLSESHHLNTGIKAETVVADSKYGTVENVWVVMFEA
ncbi:MAG TPA: transposase [Thermodesulfobacteriota bacterium]|nr:transposase [Thermodesulfobacteriota bacterium]